MTIKGIELPDIDLFDYESAEKWENAYEKLLKSINNIPENARLSESIKAQCTAVFELFNDIFGDGTDKKIFGEKTNLKECLSAVEELKNAESRYSEENSQELKSLIAKYSPERAER